VLPKIPVYVDSPLAVNATVIFGSHPECYDDELNEYLLKDDNPFGFNELHYIRSVEDSKALNDKPEPCIIISASGMMNAGRVKHHLANNLADKKNTVLVVGYCSPGTPGAKLIAGWRTSATPPAKYSSCMASSTHMQYPKPTARQNPCSQPTPAGTKAAGRPYFLF